MEEARHRGLDRVQFESDSKVLIEAIHMKRRGNSEFLSIVHDILSLMSSFINFEVKFVRRQANLVAHTLDRAANSWASFHRFENIPFSPLLRYPFHRVARTEISRCCVRTSILGLEVFSWSVAALRVCGYNARVFRLRKNTGTGYVSVPVPADTGVLVLAFCDYGLVINDEKRDKYNEKRDKEGDFYLDQSRPDGGARRLFLRFVQANPEGGCVPADTPTLKSVENAGETCAIQRSDGSGPCTLGFARRPKGGCPQRVGHFRPSPEQEPPKSSCSDDVDEGILCLLGAPTICSLGGSKFVEPCRGDPILVMSTMRSFARWGHRRSVRLGAASLLRVVEEGNVWGNIDEFLRGIVAHLLRSMDVTWMDKLLHPPPPRVKAILSTQVPVSSNGPDVSGAPSLRAGVMAEEQTPASTSNVDGDDYAWVADEPRTTVSKFSLNGGDGMFRTVQRSSLDDWKACIPNTSRRICSKFQWGSFPMYQIAFEHMGYRLPFSDFEVAVFRYLHLTPSQLHPNSLAFIRAFEMTAAFLGFMPTIPLFFHAFHLQRSRPKGDAANKFGWVSLKQSVKLFEMFLESVRGFKDSYFFVKPLTSIAWQSLIYQGPAKDATGVQLVSPDGRPVMEDYSRFPLSWRKSHYLKTASDFIYSAEELTVEELSNYEQMKVFVSSFPRKCYEDEDGNPVLDEMGVPATKKTFIDTKKLLVSKNVAEMEACFSMLVILYFIFVSKAAKEKRQAAVLGSSSNVAPSPGGDMMDNARGSTVVVDLEDVVINANADSQPRPAKIARVDQGNNSATGRVLPTSPKFVLPPAIGSPDLVRKSLVSLSDAEQAIMNDMGPEALKNEPVDAMVASFKLMEIFSFLNDRECKYLEERDAAREEAVLANQKLKQAKVNHAAYKEKYTIQAGLVTKLAEKETEAARLVGEKAELEGRVKDLTTEKETLEGKMRDLESRPYSSGTAPDDDELVVDPNGEYKGFTRAALVSRIFELEAQQLDIAKSSFDNAVAQLMVLNPGVDLVVAGASELKEVHDGVIVSPPPEEED
ncbi:hypothetical protein TSUD_88710 [Trifolium subterraneum]|uniref:UBX domain-containing protein n=1 Tax=Trifolium subterraneum TaxID=3900 RepID=A0A2Z6P6P4_TRISU|nr:hypothetical protein TSUD_88710 [Trifolium subterraneum]